MSDFEAMASRLEMSTPVKSLETQVEIIWQMGMASLSSNNNELILPQHMAANLPPASVEDLKLKLSRHIGAPTMAFLDQESQLFRICQIPSLVQTGDSPGSFSSPAPSNDSRSSATPVPDPHPMGKSSFRGGKSIVPRPPNAFILYRKDRHPVLKRDNPSLHNNDISIKLGREWKEQSEAVQAEYRARAKRIKQQHAVDNPGYQYAPRKPGDKKRRMTKKKLACMRSADSIQDVTDHVRSNADSNPLLDLDSEDDISKSSQPTRPLTAEDYIGTRKSPYVSHLTIKDDRNVEVILPSNNANIFSEVQAYETLHGVLLTNLFNSGNSSQVATSVPQYVQNDDAFVNSLIDWEGIAKDNSILKNATPENLAELADLELGNSLLDLSTENTRKAFEDELKRTMGFF